MTEQEQRIAIAEACGWKLHRANVWIPPDGNWVEPSDYLRDLNAIFAAQSTITDIDGYERQLRLVTLRDGKEGADLCRRLIFATAAQRAEAFLRTIGKWKD